MEDVGVLRNRLEQAIEQGDWFEPSSPEEREIPATLIREFLIAPEGTTGGHPVKIRNTSVTGSLDLEGQTLRSLVHFEKCQLEGEIVLNYATGSVIRFGGCEIDSLLGYQLQTDGDLYLRGTTFAGSMSLLGANIGGELDMNGVSLGEGHGQAFEGDRLQVGQGMFCRRYNETPFSAIGEVRLAGAHIKGPLVFDGASLENPGGVALNADGIWVGQDVSFQVDERGEFNARGVVSFAGAQIGGWLSFRGAKLSNAGGLALSADGSEVRGDLVCDASDDTLFRATGELRLIGAHVGGSLTFHAAQVGEGAKIAINADRIRVDHAFSCRSMGERRFEADSQVRLLGAQIGGQLVFDGATLKGDTYALSADGADIAQGLFVGAPEGGGSFAATGEVRLPGARVGGWCSFNRATFDNPQGPALNLDRIRIDGGFQFDSSTAKGEVRLLGAYVSGQLDFNSATLENELGPALNAEGVEAGQGIFCRSEADAGEFTAVGGVRLGDVKTAGQVEFRDVTLTMGPGIALDIEGGAIGNDVLVMGKVEGMIALGQVRIERVLTLAAEAQGDTPVFTDLSESSVGSLQVILGNADQMTLDLRRARIGVLQDLTCTDGKWPKAYLEGCVYGAMKPLARSAGQVKERLSWISHDPDGYSPQPYEQLREIYRTAGYEDAVRRVGIYGQKRRREGLGRLGWVWSMTLGATIAHGYRPSQALGWLLGLFAVAIALFCFVFTSGPIGSGADLTPASGNSSSFEPVTYAFDAVVPALGLGQTGAWNAHGGASAAVLALSAAGWLLAAAVLAGISVRRQ